MPEEGTGRVSGAESAMSWVLGGASLARAAWFTGVGLLALAASIRPVRGLETDQFTPPPKPLDDISPQFQQHATAVLQRVISRANIRHLDAARAARRTSKKGWKQEHFKKAARYLTEDYIARALFDEAGH